MRNKKDYNKGIKMLLIYLGGACASILIGIQIGIYLTT